MVISSIETALAGRYQVERELGRGSTAVVYAAWDRQYEREVAVKVLHPDLAASIGPDRFVREIRVAAALSHPNIVPVYDSGTAAGLLYYTMPLVRGESLRERLRREVQLRVEDAIAIARDVAAALAYAHAQGVVHRDIKPENILLAGERAIVADFGVARAIEVAASERLTETGLAVGTPVYMSPEQAAAGRIDGRSDLYSLGCLLYEMLAGEPPYSGTTAQAILAKHMRAPIPDVRVVRPLVPPAVCGAIRRSLAKVPADRFATMEEFRGALLNGGLRRWRWQAASIGAIGAIGALVLALFRGGVWSTHRSASSGDSLLAPNRLAVLYFDAQSGETMLRDIATGLTDELILELSGVSGFQVVSRNGVRPFQDRRVPFDSMVRALRAGIIVDGSVTRSEDRVRARAQLIDTRSNTYVDSLSFEWPFSDRIALERRMAQELAAGLRRQLGREARLRSASLGSSDPRATLVASKAQRAWEDARIMAEQRHPRDLATALTMLDRADSLFTLAQRRDTSWTRIAIDRGWVARERAVLLDEPGRSAALRAGLALAERAVRREPGNAAALELRGVLRWRLIAEPQTSADGPTRLAQAEQDLRDALDRDSTLVRAWANLSDLLWFQGNTGEAGMAAERAVRQDTYLLEARLVLVQLFYSDLMLGRFTRAGQWCQRGRWTFPEDWRFVECDLTLMRHDAGAIPRPDSAWRLVRLLEQLHPPDRAASEGRRYHTIYRRIVAATISARAGDRRLARTELDRARRAVAGDSVLRIDLDYDEAYLRLVLGQRELAARLLARYFEARPLARDYLARDPLFSDLRLSPSPARR